MVTLTVDELAAMQARIASGHLPPDALEKHYDNERRQVFGVDVKFDKHGNPIEQGIGSAQQLD